MLNHLSQVAKKKSGFQAIDLKRVAFDLVFNNICPESCNRKSPKAER